MPANLPPQYFEAERAFREAKTAEEKIAAIEEMLAIMPKHKGTDHLKAELRAKIARLTESMGKKAGGHRAATVIPKEGAAQVHKDFIARLRYARVWGSGKHDGVMMRRDHVMQDGDIIELHIQERS